MRTVKELKNWLEQFPEDSEVCGYEGEVAGVIVMWEGKSFAFHNNLGGNADLSSNSMVSLLYPPSEDPVKDDMLPGKLKKRKKI